MNTKTIILAIALFTLPSLPAFAVNPIENNALSASTVSADEIIAKAEDHDGIVVGGFYLGMSPDDALVLCKHYFGHLGTVKLNKVVQKTEPGLWDFETYFILKKCDGTYEGIVLVKEDGACQAICGIGKKQDKGPTAVEKMGAAKRVVNSFRFDSKMIRALIGQKKVMSTSELGRAFFRKIGLDAEILSNDDMEFKTPERESLIYDNELSKIYFGSYLRMDNIPSYPFSDIEKAESVVEW